MSGEETNIGLTSSHTFSALPEKTKILLIRHCEATGNTDGVFQGRIDTDISPNGAKQLELLALRCRNMKIDAVVSSPLLRAVRTAEAVNQYHRLPLETEPLLAEIDAGEFEGVKWEELPLRFPEATRQWYEEPWNFQAPGGESMRQVYDRVWKGILQVVEKHRGHTICVTSHGFAIRNLLCRAKGLPIERIGEIQWMDNTAISILEFSGETCLGVPVLGDASHLSPETSHFSSQSWWKQ